MRPDLPGAGSRRGVISAGIFLCILVTGVTIGLMVELRQRTIAGSQRELLRFGTLVTEVAERALQAIDLAERDVLEDMRQKGVDSPAALAIYAQPEAMHDQLKKRITGLPQSEALSIVDADGAVLSFSAMWPSTGVSFAQRPYFERAKAAGSPDMFLSLVMPQFGDDKPALFIIHRVTTTDGRFLGVISGRVHGAYFQDLYKSVMPEGASTIALSLSDGTLALRYPPAPEFVGRAFAWLVMPPGRVEPMVFENVSPIDHLGRYVSMTALSNYPATIAVAVQKQTVLAPWRTEATLLGFGAGLLDLAIVGGIVLMLRQRRIERGALAATQLEADAKSRHERDRSIREGQVATDRAATLSNLASTFESKIGQVSRAVAKAAGYVQDGANNVTDLAGNASSRTRDAAAAAAAAAVTVTAMATATKALTGSIEQVARQSIQGAKLVSTAARAAHDADATVATLTASAETIGQIVDTISAIAQQTNLLALNATIEAARAGDTGRGFAVVAGEVKNLAKAVSDATTDIKQQIEGMQAATMQTAMAMQEIRKFVTEINAISVETTRAMEHQRTTTLQIAGTMVGAADDARALSVHVSDASLATAQTGTTAVSMKIVAHDLADQAAALQSASKQFLEQVHAA